MRNTSRSVLADVFVAKVRVIWRKLRSTLITSRQVHISEGMIMCATRTCLEQSKMRRNSGRVEATEKTG